MDPKIDPQDPTQNPKVSIPSVPAQTGAGHVDFDKLLLPKKKYAPSVDSAQRINAGVLLEQEQIATEKGLQPELPSQKVLGSASPQPDHFAQEVPADAPAKKERELVQPLQTYQSDIESIVGQKQVSVVSIAAAEAERRDQAAQSTDPAVIAQRRLVEEERRRVLKWRLFMVAGGVVLLLIAGGIAYYLIQRSATVAVQGQAAAPFLFVDNTELVQMPASGARDDLMQALVEARDQAHVSVGLVDRFQVVEAASSSPTGLKETSAQAFLQVLAPQAPQALVRTLEPQFLLGVHSFDENQPFMILKVDSYEVAYSAMLAWENTLQDDLSPLFVRTPSPHITDLIPVPAAPIPPASTSSTSSNPSASSPAAPVQPLPQFIAGNFVDQIVENHDARVIKNAAGDILLLWTFLDRGTIVITTNGSTLREVISRLSQAPVVSLPTP